MKIENIEIDIINIDLTRPYTIAYKTTSSIKTLVIKVILSNGDFGLGASSLSKYVVGFETMPHNKGGEGALFVQLKDNYKYKL